MTTQLSHNAIVRLASWGHDFATVGTITGVAAAHDRDADAYRLHAIDKGFDLAWTVHSGGTLVGDRKLAATMAATHKAKVSLAVVIAHGELVEIDGEQFTVYVNRGNEREPRNCDPIKFIRVAA